MKAVSNIAGMHLNEKYHVYEDVRAKFPLIQVSY